jgi:hypothetical protein
MKIEIKHRYTDTVLCSFEANDLREAVFKAVSDGANLYEANLREADLHGAYLYEANLRGANLYEANLRGANLYEANLRGANLRGANLRGADLYGANLRGANLRGADLYGANLYGANLRGADLYGANLRGADLYGANLYGANLRGANLEGEKLAIAPVLIGGLTWDVCISESYMRIGCQRHTHGEWKEFDDESIAGMSGNALEFWNQHKAWILAACDSHREQSLAYRKANPEPVEEPEAA